MQGGLLVQRVHLNYRDSRRVAYTPNDGGIIARLPDARTIAGSRSIDGGMPIAIYRIASQLGMSAQIGMSGLERRSHIKCSAISFNAYSRFLMKALPEADSGNLRT